MGAPIIIGRLWQLAMTCALRANDGLANRVTPPYRRASHQPQRGDGTVGT